MNGRGSSPASSLDRVSPALLTSYGLESVKTSMQSAQQPPPPQQMEYMTMPPLDYGMDMMMVHNQAAAAQAAAAHQQPPGPPPVQQPPHGQPPHHQVPPQMVASAQPYIPSQYMTGHYAVVPASSTGQGGPHAGQAGPFVSTNNYVTSNSLQHVNHPQLAAAAASHMQYGQQPYVHQPVVSQGNSFVPNTGRLSYTFLRTLFDNIFLKASMV